MIISPLNSSRFKKTNIFVKTIYPEKNIRRILAQFLYLKRPVPRIIEIIADMNTNINTLKGFLKKVTNKLITVIRPINSSKSAIAFTIFLSGIITNSIA